MGELILDRTAEYQGVVKEAIREVRDNSRPGSDCELVLVFDDDSSNYVVILTGWLDRRHVNYTLIHIAVRMGKIHVYHDGLKDGVISLLLERGVPETEMVLEWHRPHARKYTPFALA